MRLWRESRREEGPQNPLPGRRLSYRSRSRGTWWARLGARPSSRGFGGRQREGTPAADRSSSPALDVMVGQRGRRRPGTALHGWATRRRAAARTGYSGPPGEIRSPRAVEFAFLVWLVGDKLAMDVTPNARLGGLAVSKCGRDLGKWPSGCGTPAEGCCGCHGWSTCP